MFPPIRLPERFYLMLNYFPCFNWLILLEILMRHNLQFLPPSPNIVLVRTTICGLNLVFNGFLLGTILSDLGVL